MALSVWNDNKVLKKWVKKNQEKFFDGNFNFNMMDLYSDPFLETLSNHLNVEKKYIYPGAGSSQFIPAIIGLRCWKKIYLSIPEFGLYTRSVRAFNINYEEIFSITCNDFIEQLIKKKTDKNDLLVISSPRWFSGERFNNTQISKLLNVFKGSILIDEAYISFSKNPDGLLNLALNNDRLMVIRSFSKKYFLSGLRVGYMITIKDIPYFRDTIIPPHSVSTHSSRLCAELLNDEKMLKVFDNANNCIKSSRDYLYEYLKNNDNIVVFKSEANFITFMVKNKKYYDHCKNILNISGIQFFEYNQYYYIKIWIADKHFSDEIIKRLNV